MTSGATRAVIGIGSTHGQDAIGWRVVERLSQSGIPDVQWIVARNPLEILDRCEGVLELHLVDACIGPIAGRIHRLQWPNDRIVDLRYTSTHGIDIPSALRLASELGMLPDSVTIWVVECEGNLTDDAWPHALQEGVNAAADQIARELVGMRP